MKALLLTAYNQLEYTETPEPSLSPTDVLVQVKACGICGSDVHGLDGSTGRRVPPLIMGHEAAGIISKLGEEVNGFAVGDRVTFDSTIYCGRCYYCRRGSINLCDNRRVLGVSCQEFRQDGAFAEYVAVPARVLYRLPEELSFEQATLVEPFAVASHAVSLAPVSPSAYILVAGTGVIGLSLIQALRAAGCESIIATDISSQRLELARQLGAEHTLRSDMPELAATVRELAHGRGVDIAFEAVGITPTVQQAVGSVRKGGSLVLVGNLSPMVELPLQEVVTREITLYGSCVSRGEYPACLELMAKGKLDAGAMISAVAPLSEGAAWFERLHQRESGLLKVILIP